jgi:hypothetical protein
MLELKGRLPVSLAFANPGGIKFSPVYLLSTCQIIEEIESATFMSVIHPHPTSIFTPSFIVASLKPCVKNRPSITGAQV